MVQKNDNGAWLTPNRDPREPAESCNQRHKFAWDSEIANCFHLRSNVYSAASIAAFNEALL